MKSCAKFQTIQSAKVCESTKLCIILYRTDPGDQTDQTNHCNWLECSKFMVQTLLNMRDGWTQVQVCEWVRNDDQCKRCYHQLDHFTEITCFRPQIAWKLCLCSSHRVWHTRVAFAKSFPLSCTLAFRNFLQMLFPLRCFRSSILYSSQTFDHSDWPPSSSWPIHICHYPQFLTTSSSCQRKHKCASSLTIWSLQTEKYFMVQNQQNQEHKCIQSRFQGKVGISALLTDILAVDASFKNKIHQDQEHKRI